MRHVLLLTVLAAGCRSDGWSGGDRANDPAYRPAGDPSAADPPDRDDIRAQRAASLAAYTAGQKK